MSNVTRGMIVESVGVKDRDCNGNVFSESGSSELARRRGGPGKNWGEGRNGGRFWLKGG